MLRKAEVNPFDTLTECNWKVFRAHAMGRMNKQIAADLGIHITTVDWHLDQIRKKLGMRLPPAIIAATKAGYFGE